MLLVEWQILMGWCKKEVTPLLKHWSYIFLALTHRYDHKIIVHHHVLPLLIVYRKLWKFMNPFITQTIMVIFVCLQSFFITGNKKTYLTCVSEWLSLTAFLGTGDIGVHITYLTWQTSHGLHQWYTVAMKWDLLNSLRPSDAYMRQWTNHHWFR